MPQVSLYMQQGTLEALRDEAQKAQVSVSKFVSHLVNDHAAGGQWPAGYWNNVYGCLQDDTFHVPAELDASLDGELPIFPA